MGRASPLAWSYKKLRVRTRSTYFQPKHWLTLLKKSCGCEPAVAYFQPKPGRMLPPVTNAILSWSLLVLSAFALNALRAATWAKMTPCARLKIAFLRLGANRDLES